MLAEEIAGAMPDTEEAARRFWLYCRENADEEYRKFNSIIVPTAGKMAGVRAPLIRAVAKPFKTQGRTSIKRFISRLWPSKIHEDRMLCAYLMAFIPEWDYVLRLSKKSDTWGLVDEICSHSLGPMLLENERFADLEKLAKSRNAWHRRIAAVSLIQWMRSEKPKKKPLAVLGLLMLDSEPMVCKATDWMLREWAKKENAAAFEYMLVWAKKGNRHTRSVLTAASHKLSPQRKKALRNAL